MAAITLTEDFVREFREAFRRKAYCFLGNWDDAEDIAQEALLKNWKAREQFQGEHPAQLFNSVETTLVHTCLDHLRQKRRENNKLVKLVGYLQEHEKHASTHEKEVEEKEEKEIIDAAIQRLPRAERIALLERWSKKDQCQHGEKRTNCDRCRNLAYKAKTSVIKYLRKRQSFNY